MDKTQRPPLDLVRLPEVLLSEDLAVVFRITPKQAGQNLASGVYGPRVPVGKRYAILREVMLRHLEELSALPEEATVSLSPLGRKCMDLVVRERRTGLSKGTSAQ